MATLAMTPNKTYFAKGVQTAKRMGMTFDGAAKVWKGDAERIWAFVDAMKMANEERTDYLFRNGLKLVNEQPSAATTWRGEKSMDHEDSIF